MNPIYPVLLENPVQKYKWGSQNAIQRLLGKEPDNHSPWAELWMGAHPKSPSRVFVNKDWIGLDKWIKANPEKILGKSTAETYKDTLPYLFKVLAADQPLSIQAHPDRIQAAKGFERETREGIPLDAAKRNYRDPWPKPELVCALETFYALIGLRKPNDISILLEQLCPKTLGPEINALRDKPGETGIREFFHSLMTLDPGSRKQILNEGLSRTNEISSLEADWIRRLYEFYPDDIGVLSPAFLNLIAIEPGQAVFIEPGILHAYLQGVGIEIMANSDNVLRGGLTQKNVDPAELLRVVRFAPQTPHYINPQPVNRFEHSYPADAREFTLSEIRISSGDTWQGPGVHSAEILLCIHGEAEVSNREGISVAIKQGGSVLVPAAAGEYQITGSTVLFKAGVPI